MARARARWAPLAADLAVVALFVAIGRRSHGSSGEGHGYFEVLWPFAVAASAGWAVAAWRGATWAREGFVLTWATTVVLGLALRRATEDHALELSFVVVTAVFLGLGMAGWRSVRTVALRRL